MTGVPSTMAMDYRALQPSQIRAFLAPWLAQHIAEPAVRDANAARIQAQVDAWSDAELAEMLATLLQMGSHPELHPADPRCRAISRLWTVDIVHGCEVRGVEHVDAALRAGPTVLLCNHLSYFDPTGTDCLLARAERADLADRVVAIAGPKVYETAFRTYASAALNTLPAPQSTTVGASDRSALRERLQAALGAVQRAHAALDEGYLVLLYGEGTRSRTGRLRSFLKGTRRYLAHAKTQVVPMAITGSDGVYGLDASVLQPTTVTLSFGEPLDVEACGGAKETLETAWHSVAALLPEAYQPEPGTEPTV